MTIYDQISLIYDWLIISERPYRDRALELLDAQHGETILEIGCGTGQTLLELAKGVGDEGYVIGLDLSLGMLEQSRNKLEKDRGNVISLLRGSGLQLPLEADSCDALFLSFTLELFDLEDQHHLLAEARRVLVENGRVALVALSTHQQTKPLSIYNSLHEIFPRVIDCVPFAPSPLLAAAGFTVTHQENELMFGLPLSIIIARSGS